MRILLLEYSRSVSSTASGFWALEKNTTDLYNTAKEMKRSVAPSRRRSRESAAIRGNHCKRFEEWVCRFGFVQTKIILIGHPDVKAEEFIEPVAERGIWLLSDLHELVIAVTHLDVRLEECETRRLA